jgi:hypothetical protein
MTNAFKNAIMMPPGIVAPIGNANGYEDAVDQAVEALGSVSGGDVCSHVLAYIRAKMWVNGSLASGLVDRKGNPVTSGAYAGSIGKNVADANFNGQSSLDLSTINGDGSSSNGPFQMGSGFRLNGTQAGMTASFTVAASLRWSITPSGSVGHLFGSTDTAPLWGYFNGSGAFNFRPDGASGHAVTTPAVLTEGTAVLFWYSWDNAAQVFRCGVNNTTIAYSAASAGTYTPLSTGKINLFGLNGLNNGNAFAGQCEGMIVLDKAYMNGSVPGDDALFTSLISTWAALIE